ncbi:hypothetical protein I3W98_16690, partial [Streptomyces cavourensis]|nr:hypothetical protein [Streptomyces cavourensis]
MLPIVYGSRIGRLSTAAALVWLVAVPPSAHADSCAVAITGQGDGSTAVAVAGSKGCVVTTPEPHRPSRMSTPVNVAVIYYSSTGT